MDLSGLYKNEFLEDYDESNNHSWEKTGELFTEQYDREIWLTKKETIQKEYESAAALCQCNPDRNLSATREAPVEASAAAMEYIAALEERSVIQDRKTAEIENHGRNVSITRTNTAAVINLSRISSRSSGSTANVQLSEMKATMQKIAETV